MCYGRPRVERRGHKVFVHGESSVPPSEGASEVEPVLVCQCSHCGCTCVKNLCPFDVRLYSFRRHVRPHGRNQRVAGVVKDCCRDTTSRDSTAHQGKQRSRDTTATPASDRTTPIVTPQPTVSPRHQPPPRHQPSPATNVSPRHLPPPSGRSWSATAGTRITSVHWNSPLRWRPGGLSG